MVARVRRGRSGITLTEILISILILGVGMISLATLFPLGLLRMRDAQRFSRSKFLADAAEAELGIRNLLGKASFLNPYFANNNGNYWFIDSNNKYYDPFIQDTGSYGGAAAGSGVTHAVGPGLPIAYDPLWRWAVYTQSDLSPPNNPNLLGFPGGPAEGRFGSGIGFIRPDPNPGSGAGGLSNPPNSTPSAHGLQRLSNFSPTLTFPYSVNASNLTLFSWNTVPEIFVSPEDIVTQGDAGGQQVVGESTVVPSNTNPGGQFNYAADWRYSWMFTGQRFSSSGADLNVPVGGDQYMGDIVIFENRQFGIDQVSTPFGGSLYVPSGETVVEAVFGYSTNVVATLPGSSQGVASPPLPSSSVGWGVAANRVVLLRWPDTMPDPEVKVGSWIADVTYERYAGNEAVRWTPPDFPLQRCNWYQVVKRTDAVPSAQREGSWSGDPTTYRSMIVWVGTPLKAQTLMSAGSGTSPAQPYHVNAALICPQVVFVYPTTVDSH